MTKQEIINGLRSLGLKEGDIVLLHSSLYSLGHVEGGPDAVIDAFLETIGSEGTLLVPVFGNLGVLTTTLKNRPGAVVSPCPVGTVAALGKDAEELCRDHWKPVSCHGEGTPFKRIADKGGYVCLMGVDQDRNTSLHGIEAELRLAYLRETTQTFTTPEGESVTKTWKYYPGPHRDFIAIDHELKARGFLKQGRIGNSQVRLINAKGMWECGMELGTADPAFILCDNPGCKDCVRQRAALMSDFFSKEDFKLTVSSRLAGRYVPEMVENCKAAGVAYIELDFIQGAPAASLPAEKLAAAVAELAADGISVSALRAFAAPDKAVEFAEKVKAAGIGRVILPLSSSGEAAEACAAAGLAIDFFNANLTSKAVNAALARRREKVADCGICFNPANFVMAGERAFTIYRSGRFIKTMRQLDINDILPDGTVTALARGGAEIKEMISIARCASFPGFMCLAGGVKVAQDLKSMVADFRRLIENM